MEVEHDDDVDAVGSELMLHGGVDDDVDDEGEVEVADPASSLF